MRRDVMKQFGSNISRELAGCERAVDLGLISMMRMSATMMEARMGLGMNICVQNDLLQQAGGMITSDFERRDQLIKMHAALAALGDRLGLNTRMLGDGGDKGDTDTFAPVTPMGLVSNDVREAA